MSQKSIQLFKEGQEIFKEEERKGRRMEEEEKGGWERGRETQMEGGVKGEGWRVLSE